MKRKKMYITLGIVVLVAVVAVVVLQHPAFGSLPSGARLERIKQSPNYRDGAFQNQEPTPTVTSDESIFKQLWDYAFNKPKNTSPTQEMKTIKTDLHQLDLSKDQVVWFGHSSYLLVVDGKKILVDPVLTSEFPSSLMMKPFQWRCSLHS